LGELFNSSTIKWGRNHPPQNSTNACVTVTLNAQGGITALTTTNCDNKVNYICEVRNNVRAVFKHFLNGEFQMEDTNGESLTKARNELCQKAFNVTDGILHIK
jgi:hypothetical protein